MKDVERAKQLLKSGAYTAVLCKGDQIYTSSLRGVKPLVLWYEDGQDYLEFCAADKVVGKATAFLYLLLGVKGLYASVISKPALDVLQNCGIFVDYGQITENIINRQGSGICPFEQQVLTITDKIAAYKAIRKKMSEMNITLS